MDCPPPPARLAIVIMPAELVYMYQYITTPGQPITVGVKLFPLDKSIPEDKYISWEVCRIFRNRSGEPSGMRAEHLCKWLIDATRDNIPDATN